MPSFQTALVYPGAVLLEGTNISEGRGTTRPFEFLGSPFIDNTWLIKELKMCQLKGVQFVPIFFKPEYSKFSNTVCRGILVVVENIKDFNAFQTYYEIIRLIRNLYADQFEWKQPPYEYETKQLPIDMICGTDFIRKSIETGLSYDEISSSITSEIENYKKEIANYVLYSFF
jgi:uncharacterized protein YbbC (DUF1343 family)